MSITTGSRQLLETREQVIIVFEELIRGDSIRKIQYGREITLPGLQWIFCCLSCRHTRLSRMARMQIRKNWRLSIRKNHRKFQNSSRWYLSIREACQKSQKCFQRRCFHRQQPVSAKKKVSLDAEFAVCVDVHPFSVCYGHPGMKQFAQSIFEIGQTVPNNEKIDPKRYLSGRTAVKSAVRNQANSCVQNSPQKYKAGYCNTEVRPLLMAST